MVSKALLFRRSGGPDRIALFRGLNIKSPGDVSGVDRRSKSKVNSERAPFASGAIGRRRSK